MRPLPVLARRVGFAVAAAILLVGIPTADAQTCGGSWDHLRSFAGSTDHEALFEVPVIADKIDQIMGPRKGMLPLLLAVRTPMNLIDCILIQSAFAKSASCIDEAIVAVDLRNRNVFIGTMNHGSLFEVYGHLGEMDIEEASWQKPGLGVVIEFLEEKLAGCAEGIADGGGIFVRQPGWGSDDYEYEED